MENSNLIIHVGLHKTGTTFLQENLFPEFNNIKLLRGWNTFRDLMGYHPQKKFLISDEGLSGRILQGNYIEEFYRNIDLLRKVFNNPKIVIGFRFHCDFLFSIYKQYLHSGGYKEFSYIFNLENTGLIKKDDLLFKPRINYLKENFDDVFIYTQESLKNRMPEFIKEFLNFSGISEEINFERIQKKKSQNIGVQTDLQMNTLRFMNKVSNRLEKIPFFPNFYSARMRSWNLTPRNFCQNFLKNIKSREACIDNALKMNIDSMYQEDWDSVNKYLSY